jgi:Fe-S cluster assembly scaffold protein SufB
MRLLKYVVADHIRVIARDESLKAGERVKRYLSMQTSRIDAYPVITVRATGSAVQHEARVSQLSAEQIFYTEQRGLLRRRR